MIQRRSNRLRDSSVGIQNSIHRWMLSVLHLDPMLLLASAVGSIPVLRNHAF
jgi:hypothetical protein